MEEANLEWEMADDAPHEEPAEDAGGCDLHSDGEPAEDAGEAYWDFKGDSADATDDGDPGGDDDTSDGGAADDRTSAGGTVNDACFDGKVTVDAPHELMRVLMEAVWNRNSGEACWDPVPAGNGPDTRRSIGANGAWDCGMMPCRKDSLV